MKVLYIEDDFVDQIAFKRLARKFDNLNFQVVDSLNDALHLMETHKFDLVLSDYFLAGDTVVDVMESIKEVPIFLVSGLEDTNHIKQLFNQGNLQGYFFKPLSENDILSILSKNGNLVCKKKPLTAISPKLKPDLSSLDKLSQNSDQLKIELMEIFLMIAGKEKTIINSNLEKKDWKAISLSVHKLKSNLRMMGYQPLLDKANEIEINCLNLKSLDSMSQEIPTFINNLENGIKMIEIELMSLKNSAKI